LILFGPFDSPKKVEAVQIDLLPIEDSKPLEQSETVEDKSGDIHKYSKEEEDMRL